MFLQPVLNMMTAAQPLLGGALPTFFSWNPSLDEPLPNGTSFARGTFAMYRNDSGVWQTTAGVNDIRSAHNVTPGGGNKGFLQEQNTTKLALFPRDLTNGVWVATNITPALDAVGITGVSNSASTLTATAANGTIFQSFTRASSAHTFSCFVARKTGTGTIEITIDGGISYTDITSSLTSNIDNVFLVTKTLANPSIGFRIVTSGDEIEVDMADMEALAIATSPVIHTSSTVIRALDLLTGPAVPATGWSGLIDGTVAYTRGGAQPVMIGIGAGTDSIFINSDNIVRYLTGTGISVVVTAATPYLDERHVFQFSTDTNNHQVIDDEGNSAVDTSGTLPSGTLTIGLRGNGTLSWNSTLHNIQLYSVTQELI